MYIDPVLLSAPESILPNYPDSGKAIPWPITNGTLYQFYRLGDVLPEHSHPVGQSHLSFLMQGSVVYNVTQADGSVTSQSFSAPALVMASEVLEHSFTCTCDNTVLVNIRMANIGSANIQKQIDEVGKMLDGLSARVAGAKALV
jgi:hypothetical protein